MMTVGLLIDGKAVQKQEAKTTTKADNAKTTTKADNAKAGEEAGE